MKTKFCPKCKQDKPVSKFYKDSRRKSGTCGWCKECSLVYRRARYHRNPQGWSEQQRKYKEKVKKEVLAHYGNGKLACVICGFNDIRALSIDHLDGGGMKHRAKSGLRGLTFYRWLRREGFPLGYQTLCMNCQFIKREEKGEHHGGRPRIYF